MIIACFVGRFGRSASRPPSFVRYKALNKLLISFVHEAMKQERIALSQDCFRQFRWTL